MFARFSPYRGIYASVDRNSTGSDNGVSSIRRQAIIWANTGSLLIGPLGTNFNDILIKKLFIHENASGNVVCEIAAILSRGGSGGWKVVGWGVGWGWGGVGVGGGVLRINCHIGIYKQRVFMHGHQGWNVRHGLCHIYMIYVYIWVVYSFCLFCCLFIIVTTQLMALYKPCKPKPKFR